MDRHDRVSNVRAVGLGKNSEKKKNPEEYCASRENPLNKVAYVAIQLPRIPQTSQRSSKTNSHKQARHLRKMNDRLLGKKSLAYQRQQKRSLLEISIK
jgi:hypothetical protein